MKNPKHLYTIITGASTGLGKELAIECAQRKMNLILVSLPDEKLEQLSKTLSSTYQVRVSFFETDLTKRDSLEELVDQLNQNFAINMLINNAGIGGTSQLIDASVDYLDNIIQLNIRATTLLTRLLLPELHKHPASYILNVSSLAAFSPVPFKTIYPASKAFIYHFTRGLKAELQDSNIKVSVLNPGPILTNTDVSERINGQSSYIKLSIMHPSQIAQIAIKKLLCGKAVIIPGFMNRLNAFVIRIVPENFRINVGTAIFKREFNNKQPNEGFSNRS